MPRMSLQPLDKNIWLLKLFFFDRLPASFGRRLALLELAYHLGSGALYHPAFSLEIDRSKGGGTCLLIGIALGLHLHKFVGNDLDLLEVFLRYTYELTIINNDAASLSNSTETLTLH